ncbi:MAG TPA: RNA methyltransferase [Methanomicrobia archaeon]|nr:RNA methyltransferase [Methanomicrobia archaeon]
MDVRVILVEPKLAENIGAVARVLKNFGYGKQLYLVNPPALTEKMFWVASHAGDVLRASIVVSSLEDAIAGSTLVVGTTAKTGISATRHLRKPLFPPRELVAKVAECGGEGVLALLFGPEDRGLLNDELVHCDLLVSIPTSAAYPVLNLSHAVAIVLYELYAGQQSCEPGSSMAQQPPALAAVADKERLFEHISSFLEEIEYRAHRRERTLLLLRRLLGRAVLTAREVRTLRGILRSAERTLREQEKRERQ